MSTNTPVNIKDHLQKVINGSRLGKAEAKSVLTSIGEGRVNEFQTASLLTCYQMRPITGEELSGFREAMIDLALNIDISDMEAIDMCGTGGDGKDTFNISTTASFVVAGAGYKVAKHGNKAVSSNCGSSNVLEFLGYKMTNEADKLRSTLDKGNFCYMHAPLFHPAMRFVGAIRRGLGIKTFFNLLGPLLNPARPGYQLTGVFDKSILPLYKAVFEDMGIQYAIVHSQDGYDEISLTSPFELRSNQYDGLVEPASLGYSLVDSAALKGGVTVEESAKMLTNILAGAGTSEQEAVVCANAAYAIKCFKPEQDIADCLSEAKESIDSGKALAMLKNVTA